MAPFFLLNPETPRSVFKKSQKASKNGQKIISLTFAGSILLYVKLWAQSLTQKSFPLSTVSFAPKFSYFGR